MFALLLLLSPEFVNVAAEAGLEGPAAGRAVLVDLNGDGALDVVLNRQHFFVQVPGEDGPRFRKGPGLPFVPDVLLFADFDNDGDQDAFAGVFCEPESPEWRKKKDKGHRSRVFLNRGKKGWKETKARFPETSVHAACALDADRDGKLDLFVGSGYRVYGRSLESFPDRLYRGRGDGTFEDVTEKAGLLTRRAPGHANSSKPTYGVTHGDFDGDGHQDLWVCTYGRQWNFLWRNRGDGTFENVAPKTGFDGDKDRTGRYPPWLKDLWKKRYGREREDEKPFRSNGNTFDCAVADFDNDGDMDCILAEITHAWAGSSSDLTALLVQEDGKFVRRPSVFERPRIPQRWNQGDIHCGWMDYDNDGLLDALIASSDYPDRQELKLYRQRPDHTFEEMRTFDWEGAGQISVGDVDGDGDLDLLVGRSLNRLPKERREALGRSCGLFRNDVGHKNHWISVQCVGKAANRSGIGCRIRLRTADGVVQTREIRGGLGHAGHSGPPVAHFGLGRHERAEWIEVSWPDRKGSRTRLEKVRSRQRLVIRQ